jgi:hypothetical protein
MVTTLGNTVDESLNIRVGRFSISRHLQRRIPHNFVLSAVDEDGMKCLFGYTSQLIYASQPMDGGWVRDGASYRLPACTPYIQWGKIILPQLGPQGQMCEEKARYRCSMLDRTKTAVVA